MNRIAEFEKVSFSQFLSDWINIFNIELKEHVENTVTEIYDKIKMPVRATKGSAGYDFKAPFDIELNAGESLKVPTGIRCKIDDGWVLKLYPRSSLGFKYRMQFNNTVGIIDSDYYASNNEGHIIAKIHNDSKDRKILCMKQGDNFIQGIFLPYGITVDDETSNIRNGGFGSTGR